MPLYCFTLLYAVIIRATYRSNYIGVGDWANPIDAFGQIDG